MLHFPTVEECDFDQQCLFQYYFVISRGYDIVSVTRKLNNSPFLLYALYIEFNDLIFTYM